MSRNKETDSTLSSAEEQQIEQFLKQVPEIATQIVDLPRQTEIVSLLQPITILSDVAQITLLKAIAKLNDTASADIALAFYTYNTQKEVRKEAKRALIRLASGKHFPRWEPQPEEPVVSSNTFQAPRFWQGWVSQTREEGEIQLILTWEQGNDARLLMCTLDFWKQGLKYCLLDAGVKRHIEDYSHELRQRMPDTPFVSCTLAEGRSLIKEALSLNSWRNAEPYSNFQTNRPLIERLLQWDEESIPASARLIQTDLDPAEVAINYLGAWALGDYGLAYDLLSQQSEIREGEDREQWISKRRAWHDEAKPSYLELSFVHERTPIDAELGLPISEQATNRVVDLGWSLELQDTPLSGTLTETVMGTAISKDTHRYWSWASYTLIQEQGVWRIQQMRDEGAQAQGLSVEELHKRVKEGQKLITQLMEANPQPSEDIVEDVSWHQTRLLHYYDALIALLPQEFAVLEEAYGQAILAGNLERVLVYLERLVQRFPQQKRTEHLRRLGSTFATLAYKRDDPESDARRQLLLEKAEQALRQALAAEPLALGHILLAELFLSQNRHYEAEIELADAQKLQPTEQDALPIAAGLGNIAMRRDQYAEAIPHFEKVAELNPQHPGIWFNLGFANRLLDNLEAAEQYYQKAVAQEPQDARPYAELVALYMKQARRQDARNIAEQAIVANPQSAHLQALLASVLLELGDRFRAERRLEIAEQLDPHLDFVQSVRHHFEEQASKKRR
jgi:Flp pilus assembly protein TadD